MPQNKNNAWYIKGIKEQDINVLRVLSADFYPMVKDYVLKNSGTLEDAEDLFSEVTIIIYQKVQDEEFKLTSELSTYLYAIAQNLWLKKLRRKKYKSDVTIDDPMVYKEVQELEELMEKTEEYQLMREKFQLLSKKCQRVFDLSWYSDKSGKEIAEDMGWTHAYLRKRKTECKDKLIGFVRNDPRFLELKES
jgi:RNA polymerase sigma factor (sigma-70 family)